MTKRSPGPSPRQVAFRIVRSLIRPPGIKNSEWLYLTRFLEVIAAYQPDCFIGQQALAEQSSMSVRMVQKCVALGRRIGVLVVIPDAGAKQSKSPSRTNKYLIVKPSELPASAAPGACTELPATAAPGAYKTIQLLRNCIVEREPPVPVLRTGTSVRRACGPTPSENGAMKITAAEALAAANERGRIRKRPPAPDRDPARRLVGHFVERWDVEVAARDLHRDVRPLDTVGEAVGYTRTTFLRPAAGRTHTEAEVTVFMDDFMQAVLLGEARLKPGQSAWKCFTGWWGRKPVPVYDDGAYERYRPPHA